MRMILMCLYMFFSLIFLKPLQMRAMYLKKHGREEECYRITDKWVPLWMGTILKITGIRVEVEGAEHFPPSPAIYVCNHQGMVDIPVLLTHLGKPRAMMSKAAIGKVPLLRGWMELFDCLFVVRNDPQSARACYEDAVRLVKRGRDLCIFPEGTRSKDGGIGAFKTGSFRIAGSTGAPIVPLYLSGTRALFEGNGHWVRPGVVKLKLFAPIETASLSREELKQLPLQVHAMMDASLREYAGLPPAQDPAAEAPVQAPTTAQATAETPAQTLPLAETVPPAPAEVTAPTENPTQAPAPAKEDDHEKV